MSSAAAGVSPALGSLVRCATQAQGCAAAHPCAPIRRLLAGSRFFQAVTWLYAGIFLLLTASLAMLMVTEPTAILLMLSTVATAARPPCGSSRSCAGSG